MKKANRKAGDMAKRLWQTVRDTRKKLARWIKMHKYELIALFIVICILIQTACLIKKSPVVKEAFREFAYGRRNEQASRIESITSIKNIAAVSRPHSHPL